MIISECKNQEAWDNFLKSRRFRPFLQSWAMGEVYKDVGQQPIRLSIEDNKKIVGICQCIFVPARRGKHLTISYGPVFNENLQDKEKENALLLLEEKLRKVGKEEKCSFIRISPFIPNSSNQKFSNIEKPSPLHLIAEHIWYLPLKENDVWDVLNKIDTESNLISTDEILKNMRKNHRNLIRRARKEGVEIMASLNPMEDIKYFHSYNKETRKLQKCTPYTKKFFDSQVSHFSSRNECTLYLAKYNNEVIASSIHMHVFGETSYHHGASTSKYSKIPASYLLQFTAIEDALKREDDVYSFWGIAPEESKNHPFKGVTTFKKGFGGKLLKLKHCIDIPIKPSYKITRTFEYIRKWKRGF